MTPSAHPVPLTGVVLAGGTSRRMGRDKARLPVDGAPLALRAARELARCCEHVMIASGDGQRLADLGWPQVADAAADAGPLGGVLAALREAHTPLVAVVAADMPDASAEVLRALAEAWRGEAVVLAEVAGRRQPLHAVWSAAEATSLADYLAGGGRSVRGFLDRSPCRVLGLRDLPAAGRDGRFARNVNRPADLGADR